MKQIHIKKFPSRHPHKTVFSCKCKSISVSKRFVTSCETSFSDAKYEIFSISESPPNHLYKMRKVEVKESLLISRLQTRKSIQKFFYFVKRMI